nr:MAG TPA: hypothetical protein [Caudoviricetes sp.]
MPSHTFPPLYSVCRSCVNKTNPLKIKSFKVLYSCLKTFSPLSFV